MFQVTVHHPKLPWNRECAYLFALCEFHTVYFDCIHLPPPTPPTCTLPSLSIHFGAFFFLKKKSTSNTICVACAFLYMWPCTEWGWLRMVNLQGSQPWSKLTFPSLSRHQSPRSLARGRTSSLPPLCMLDFVWTELGTVVKSQRPWTTTRKQCFPWHNMAAAHMNTWSWDYMHNMFLSN